MHTVAITVVVVSNVWIVRIGLRSTPCKSSRCPRRRGGYFERRLSRIDVDSAVKQFKLFQVFGVILVVHFVTIIPAIVLLAFSKTSTTARIPFLGLTFQQGTHQLFSSFSWTGLLRFGTWTKWHMGTRMVCLPSTACNESVRHHGNQGPQPQAPRGVTTRVFHGHMCHILLYAPAISPLCLFVCL